MSAKQSMMYELTIYAEINFADGSLTVAGLHESLAQLPAEMFGVFGVAMGGIILALAIFSFVVAYGLWSGKGWAWTLTVVLSVISIALNAISIPGGNFSGIISIIISAAILYYLYRPRKGVLWQGRQGRSSVLAFFR